jgi:hypothetical protein
MSDRTFENFSLMIVFCVLAIATAWVIGTIASNIRRTRVARYTADVCSRLLDRFGTSQELIAYLESDAGRNLLQSLTMDRREPAGWNTNAIQVGMVLLLFGLSLVGVRAAEHEDSIRRALLISGVPVAAVGAGFLLSALLSHRLCQEEIIGSPDRTR